jgi:hypothetical protein
VVTVKDGVATSTCNGELLDAAGIKVPATGPIASKAIAARWSTAGSGSAR